MGRSAGSLVAVRAAAGTPNPPPHPPTEPPVARWVPSVWLGPTCRGGFPHLSSPAATFTRAGARPRAASPCGALIEYDFHVAERSRRRRTIRAQRSEPARRGAG